jgi:hypothetical protein
MILGRPIRRFLIFPAITALLVAGLLAVGSLADSRNDPKAWADRTLAELRKHDPQAAKVLDQSSLRTNAIGFAAGLLDTQKQVGDFESLRTLAKRVQDGKEPFEFALARLAPDTRRDDFFYSHGATAEILRRDPLAEQDYLKKLEAGMADPRARPLIQDDPVKNVDFYREQHPADGDGTNWLGEILAQLVPLNAEGGPAEKSGVGPILETARKYAPLPRQAVVDHHLGPVGFQLFLVYGDMIRAAVEDQRLPLGEVLEVVFANPSYVADLPPGEAAQKLAKVHKNAPEVWKRAAIFPLALNLLQDTPKSAEKLLVKYGSDDVAGFIYSSYPDEVAAAAAAIVGDDQCFGYGDLALYVLRRYSGDRRAHEALKDPKLGPRVVPYLAQFGNPGLDQITANKAWLDKFFDEKGRPREKEWWVHVPVVGAPADLISNWTNGYPSTWGEMGWAALDVADGTLLLLSLGASSEVTAVKQVVKEGGKETVEVIAKAEARTAVKTAGEAAARTASREARQTAAEQLSRGGLRSALRRSAGTLWQATHVPGQVIKIGVTVGRWTVREVGGQIVRAARSSLKVWESVPPAARRWVYRGLLAAGLYVTFVERTLPNLGKIAIGAAQSAEKLITTALEPVVDGLRKAFEHFTHPADWVTLGRWSTIVLMIGVWFYLSFRVLGFRFGREPIRV